MKTFIVGCIYWYDNDLRLEKIAAANWREAWAKCPSNPFESIEEIPLDLEEAKRECFTYDCMMGHVEISDEN